jgi:hypothetical protein
MAITLVVFKPAEGDWVEMQAGELDASQSQRRRRAAELGAHAGAPSRRASIKLRPKYDERSDNGEPNGNLAKKLARAGRFGAGLRRMK